MLVIYKWYNNDIKGIFMDFKEVFKKYGISLSEKQIGQFNDYYKLLVEYNQRFNLTNIIDYDSVWLKHFLDSCLPCNCFDEDRTVLDIGGGAGFPSIPLKIIRPDLDITILDSVNKKVEFMNLVIEKLKLDNTIAIHGRCEDMAKKAEYREKFDYCVARAVAPLSTLLEYTVPFIKLDGKLVLYKGSGYGDEITLSKNTCKELDCVLENVDEVNVEELGLNRYFLIYHKNSNTKNKYPRGQNKPRTSPLN